MRVLARQLYELCSHKLRLHLRQTRGHFLQRRGKLRLAFLTTEWRSNRLLLFLDAPLAINIKHAHHEPKYSVFVKCQEIAQHLY